MSHQNENRLLRNDSPSGNALPQHTAPASPGLLEQLRQVLQSSTHREIRNAHCEIQGDTVVLQGQVSSFYLKQVAQALVASIERVQLIRNELTVVYADSRRLLAQR